MRSIFAFIIMSVLVGCSETDDTLQRDYSDIFREVSLDREQTERVKLADRLLFTKQADKVLVPQGEKLKIRYSGTFESLSKPSFKWHNELSLRLTIFRGRYGFLQGDNNEGIIVSGYRNQEHFKELQRNSRISPELTHQSISLFDGKCTFERDIEGNTISSVRAYIAFDPTFHSGISESPTAADDPTQTALMAVQCINASHLYYLGISNLGYLDQTLLGKEFGSGAPQMPIDLMWLTNFLLYQEGLEGLDRQSFLLKLAAALKESE